ncbi:hypothetical protein LRF89_12660 [Halorhodospira sp. 9621]|uniref:RusA family crossover junction endodeoxyribonuclease n=1 Tax=Halorhodospira sp. 9621 TaxID=2899135 RepID=UPI001EE845AD|nr:hypothetical protein [Halorhodospira sp. 9621]MCG5534287.1 hypothetical protein [Halorhodospira sp. 9621]
MFHRFDYSNFAWGGVSFTVQATAVSSQGKKCKKEVLKKSIQSVTKESPYIITGPCLVHIEYLCPEIRRAKNPGAYDVDNIIKPIMDSLCGMDGLLLDDVIVHAVTVNWIDHEGGDFINVRVEEPDLFFIRKKDLVLIMSQSGWCFPCARDLLKSPRAIEAIGEHFKAWDSIESDLDFQRIIGSLPKQDFVYRGKIKGKGYEVRYLEEITSTTTPGRS